MDDLDDAILEDTCHCDLCGGSFVLGAAADYVILESDGPGFSRLGAQLKLCGYCAGRVSAEHASNLRDAGICEHGVNDGDWCEPCNLEYKRARRA